MYNGTAVSQLVKALDNRFLFGLTGAHKQKCGSTTNPFKKRFESRMTPGPAVNTTFDFEFDSTQEKTKGEVAGPARHRVIKDEDGPTLSKTYHVLK